MCLKALMYTQGVILMNSKHITNYKPKDFAELLFIEKQLFILEFLLMGKKMI